MLDQRKDQPRSWLALGGLGALALAAGLAGCAQPGYGGYGNYSTAPPPAGYEQPGTNTYQAPAGSVFTGRVESIEPMDLIDQSPDRSNRLPAAALAKTLQHFLKLVLHME